MTIGDENATADLASSSLKIGQSLVSAQWSEIVLGASGAIFPGRYTSDPISLGL